MTKIQRATPELIAKLPQWAQSHIASLEREIERRDTLLDEIRTGQTSSPFSYSNLFDAGKSERRFYLPEYARLSVFAGKNRHDSKDAIDLSVTDYMVDGKRAPTLYISSPHGVLEILPACSNGAYLRVRAW